MSSIYMYQCILARIEASYCIEPPKFQHLDYLKKPQNTLLLALAIFGPRFIHKSLFESEHYE